MEFSMRTTWWRCTSRPVTPVLTSSHYCPVKLTHVTELSRPRSGPEEAEGDDQGVGCATQLHPLPQHVRRSPRRWVTSSPLLTTPPSYLSFGFFPSYLSYPSVVSVLKRVNFLKGYQSKARLLFRSFKRFIVYFLFLNLRIPILNPVCCDCFVAVDWTLAADVTEWSVVSPSSEQLPPAWCVSCKTLK